MPPPGWSREFIANATSSSMTVVASPNLPLIIVYDTLYILGVVCLLIVLIILTWLSSKTKRRDLCFWMVFSWLVEGVSHLLIIGQQTGPDPNETLCLIQAMIVYGSPAFAGLTCAGYMIQIYYTLIPTSSFHRYRIWTILLHVVPLTIFITILAEVFVVGKVVNPGSIQRDPSGMYCNLNTQHGTLAVILSDGFAIASLVIILVFEGLTFHCIRQIPTDSSPPILANAELVRNILKRVVIFSLWAGMCFGLYLLYCIPSMNGINPEIQVVWSTLPCVAALVLGTQKDIVHSSKFWKKTAAERNSA